MLNAVSAIIKNRHGQVLFQDHIKCNGYTLPGGKAMESESNVSALIRELYEELGIVVRESNCELIYSNEIKNSEYPVGSGDYIDFISNIYMVSAYENIPVNKEPNKHKSIEWLTTEELEKLDKSDILNDYINHIKNN